LPVLFSLKKIVFTLGNNDVFIDSEISTEVSSTVVNDRLSVVGICCKQLRSSISVNSELVATESYGKWEVKDNGADSDLTVKGSLTEFIEAAMPVTTTSKCDVILVLFTLSK